MISIFILVFLGSAISYFVSTILSERLEWPYWIIFAIVFLNVIFLVNLPNALKEYSAALSLYKHPLGRHVSGISSISRFYIRITIVAITPVLVLLWFIIIFLFPEHGDNPFGKCLIGFSALGWISVFAQFFIDSFVTARKINRMKQ
jgi:hypothetical protein